MLHKCYLHSGQRKKMTKTKKKKHQHCIEIFQTEMVKFHIGSLPSLFLFSFSFFALSISRPNLCSIIVIEDERFFFFVLKFVLILSSTLTQTLIHVSAAPFFHFFVKNLLRSEFAQFSVCSPTFELLLSVIHSAVFSLVFLFCSLRVAIVKIVNIARTSSLV